MMRYFQLRVNIVSSVLYDRPFSRFSWRKDWQISTEADFIQHDGSSRMNTLLVENNRKVVGKQTILCLSNLTFYLNRQKIFAIDKFLS